MKLSIKKTIAFFCGGLILALCGAALVSAQQPSPSAIAQSTRGGSWEIKHTPPSSALYVPRFVQQAYKKQTRSPDGRPGKNYWQNRSTYKMSITVMPPNRTVSATEEITYFNNSPDPLSTIPFRLYLNAHRPEAIREKPVDQTFLSSGIQVDEFRINGQVKAWNASNTPETTLQLIKLDQPLAPGASITFSIRWRYDITAAGGWKEGQIDQTTFFLAYFFPRVHPYNDTSGLDWVPFTLGREFDNDFGDYTFEVKVPKNYIVWATGDLLNPQEVLQPTYAQRLQESFTSDRVINIAQPAELKQGRVTAQSDTVTWKWQAKNVPDIAIALSNHYIWDAGSVVVDPKTGRRASVQSGYTEAAPDFKPMVEVGKRTLAWASTQYPGVPYPYSKTSIILGGTEGKGADEEYPMMVNDSSNLDSAGNPYYAFTRFVATHELLHSWFPFYMGINEKRYPFMDEGWTTAFEHLLAKEDVGTEDAIALFKSYRANAWSTPYVGNDTPIIMPHDTLFGAGSVAFSINPYGKAALGYLALKELMGDVAFKQALHEFMARWNGKHPLPWDMFNTFNDASGQNYNWFFNNWFFSYNYLDLAVKSAQPTNDGYILQVENIGGMAMPFDVNVVYADGSKASFRQNPRIWKDSPQMATIQIRSTQKLKSLTLDGGIFVDSNPADNTWKSS